MFMHTKKLRIISGKWRGRKITVPNNNVVRPTTDKIRETVFNWLMHDILGANCLDAFAGSGILGFEALSRGANRVTLVDKNQTVIRQLQCTKEQLSAKNMTIIATNFPQNFFLKNKFNIVFLDPPFKQGLILPSVHFLQEQDLLAKKALLYTEVELQLKEFKISQEWQLLKQKIAGKVIYSLFSLRQ